MLIGSWRALAPLDVSYKIIEKNHEMKAETWGYSRHNELYLSLIHIYAPLSFASNIKVKFMCK